MPLDLPDYKDLNSMYSGPLAARMAQDGYDQKSRLAQMLLEQQQQQNQETAALAPLKQQFQQGQNDAQAAHLPGLKALSRNHQLVTNAAEQTHDAQIADELGKYQGLKTSRELQQITQAASAYGQVGGYLGSIPGPARVAAAKQMLGSMWRPEFEQYSPQDLPDVLSTAGKWMGSAQTQYQQALGKQDSANEAKIKAAEIKAAQAQSLAKFKASISKTAGAIAKTDNPKNWQEAATRLMMAAAQEQDDDKREILQAQAQAFSDLIMAKERQKAQAGAETKPSLPGMGIETNAPVAPPKVVMPGPNGATPSPAKPANNPVMNDPNMAKLPQGTKALGNGVYQLPDGRKVKAN